MCIASERFQQDSIHRGPNNALHWNATSAVLRSAVLRVTGRHPALSSTLLHYFAYALENDSGVLFTFDVTSPTQASMHMHSVLLSK